MLMLSLSARTRFCTKTPFGTLISQHIHWSRCMAGRYELPEGTWPLIADLFERKKRRNELVRMTCSCSMARYGACCRDMLGHFGSWSTVYSGFATDETTAPCHEHLSSYT